MSGPRESTIRRCAKCGQAAVSVYHVTQHYNRGIPAGQTYAHRCQGCGTTFETISVWKSIFDSLMACFIALPGLMLTGNGGYQLFQVLRYSFDPRNVPGSTWSQLGFGVLLLGGATLWLGFIAWRNLALVRNPAAH